VKAQEWRWFDQEIQRRAAVGKESQPCLYDRPLPSDRVVREIARHKKEVSTATSLNREYANRYSSPRSADLSEAVPNPAPQRISVRTPPPINAITPASQSNLNPRDDGEGTSDHVNPHQPHASTTPVINRGSPPGSQVSSGTTDRA